MKIWTYKSRHVVGDVGLVVKIDEEEPIYFKIPKENIIYRGNKRKKLRLDKSCLSVMSSFTYFYFPSHLCKPIHYLEVESIYVHEIIWLLEK